MINKVKWSFAVGHVFNDLCASLWFLFTMPYLTKVLVLSNNIAGDILLIGQIADALATPSVGIESDKIGIFCGQKFGKRKSWHLLGTVLTAISFPFIFNDFFGPLGSNSWYMVVYYAPIVAIFQFAWATVQVTHLSLIPVLMREGQDNSSLNSLRYMFTVISNILVLTTTTLLFSFNNSPDPGSFKTLNNTDDSNNITPRDQRSFTYLTVGVVGLGLLVSLIFYIGVPEKKEEFSVSISSSSVNSSDDAHTPLLREARIQESCDEVVDRKSESQLSPTDWFKEPQFYLINALYLATRLIVNVSQVYLVLYIIDTLGMHKMKGTLGALVTFLAGVVTSVLLKAVQNRVGKKLCYLVGLLLVSAYCITVSFATRNDSQSRLYVSMLLLGCGSSTLMIGSLSLTAQLIGTSCSSSAFVYGCMSFSDKLFNGIAIWALQRAAPSHSNCIKCNQFYYYVQLYFVGGTALFALLVWAILVPMKIGVRRRSSRKLPTFPPTET